MRHLVWTVLFAAGCLSSTGTSHRDGGSDDLSVAGGGDLAGSGNDDLSGNVTPDLANAGPDLACAPNCPAPDPCKAAAIARSPLGCEFYAVPTVNSQLNPYFDFGIVAINPPGTGGANAPVLVTVTRGGQTIASNTVAVGSSTTITLPWIADVSQTSMCTNGACTAPAEKSTLAADAAYHVTSTGPVVVYQFNPLQFAKPATTNCTDLSGGNTCYAYTNDASLLLPVSALGQDYLGMGRGTFTLNSANALPGFLTVVGTADNTTVTVDLSSDIEAGTGVAAVTHGTTQTYTLNKGSVLQLITKRATAPCAQTSTDANGTYCDLGPTFDLTGSRIKSTAPVAVFGGHSCAFVPYNKWACNHLEEQLPPLSAWGKQAFAVQNEPWTANAEPNVWRVISGADNNQVTFDPPSVHSPVTLQTGQYLEVTVPGAFQVGGTGRLLVAQFLVGGNYLADSASNKVGDPAMGLLPPLEQLRTDYDLWAAADFTNRLNVVTPAGASLVLDGSPVSTSPTAIGTSGWVYRRIPVATGLHHLTGDRVFSVTVDGRAEYSAYLYPGGMNLGVVP